MEKYKCDSTRTAMTWCGWRKLIFLCVCAISLCYSIYVEFEQIWNNVCQNSSHIGALKIIFKFSLIFPLSYKRIHSWLTLFYKLYVYSIFQTTFILNKSRQILIFYRLWYSNTKDTRILFYVEIMFELGVKFYLYMI